MPASIDEIRKIVSSGITDKKKAQLGQFFTPSIIADFMASLFSSDTGFTSCTLLDPGAGIGSLTAAFLNHFLSPNAGKKFDDINVHAFEIDTALHPYLAKTLALFSNQTNVTTMIFYEDFIQYAVNLLRRDLFSSDFHTYTHIIMNPPYRKIRSDSLQRKLLKQADIETVNLYTAFVALAINLLDSHGELVAIIPRSFCNGPYYLPFRKLLLDKCAIRRIHIFESRDQAFKEDDVLQENIIIHLERDGIQKEVAISYSQDHELNDLKIEQYPFNQIVTPDDDQLFIHIPTDQTDNSIDINREIHYSLQEIGIEVSTGPVVDFRLKDYIRDQPDSQTVPLVYPAHFTTLRIEWPKHNSKKPNAIQKDIQTVRWLYPNGFYTVVKRFSAKEEKKRITANIVDPSTFPDETLLGFENHINIFHDGKKGLPEELAMGLFAYLNTTAVDQYFRRFNGHTQVNATDLRSIKYPSRKSLMKLGVWVKHQKMITQDLIDENWEKHL